MGARGHITIVEMYGRFRLKIVIFADSHGRILQVYDAIERENADLLIHLGDYAQDVQELQRVYPQLSFVQVRGNNDFNNEIPLQQTLVLEGLSLYLTHGHQERVSGASLGNLVREAKREHCQIAMYGHTHRMRLEMQEGILVLNPGSISLPRGGKASYAVLQIQDGALRQVQIRNTEGEPICTL